MGIFKRIFKGKPQVNNTLTNEDREKALEIRRNNARIAQLERQLETQERMINLENNIKTLKGIGSGDEDAFLKLVTPLLMGALTGNQQQQQQNNGAFFVTDVQNSQPVNNERNMQIAKLINSKVPNEYIEQLNAISDSDLIDIRRKINTLKAVQ